MSTAPTFSTQLIGQTEKTLNAILGRLLAGTGLSEPQWVTAKQLFDVSDSAVTVTDAGKQLHGRIRGVVGEITGRLWGDLPAEDLAAAGRILTTVLERASAELARL
jgi:hypothetical protein